MNLSLRRREDDFSAGLFQPAGFKSTREGPRFFWHLSGSESTMPRLPMDTFYAFGRRQDMSYSLPDPTCVLNPPPSRAHLENGLQVNGVPLWVGAATHDVRWNSRCTGCG